MPDPCGEGAVVAPRVAGGVDGGVLAVQLEAVTARGALQVVVVGPAPFRGEVRVPREARTPRLHACESDDAAPVGPRSISGVSRAASWRFWERQGERTSSRRITDTYLLSIVPRSWFYSAFLGSDFREPTAEKAPTPCTTRTSPARCVGSTSPRSSGRGEAGHARTATLRPWSARRSPRRPAGDARGVPG